MRLILLRVCILVCALVCSFSLTAGIQVVYHYPADAFNLIEQVSGATPEFFLDEEFKEEWEARFPLTEVEEKMLAQYRSIRKDQQGNKWWKRDPTDFDQTPDGLFAPNPKETADPVAHAFYTAQTFGQAWKNLSLVVDEDIVSFFQKIYGMFDPKIAQILSNKDAYQAYAPLLNERLAANEVEAHLTHIEIFYGVEPIDHRAYLFWQPRKSGFAGASDGHHLFLKIPTVSLPITDEDLNQQLAAVLVHEATHSCSAKSPRSLKQLRSTAFLEGALELDGNLPYIFALEEPLVQTLSQALYFKRNFPLLYESPDCWFSHPLVKKYLPLVEPFFGVQVDDDRALFYELGRSYYSQAKGES